MKNLTPKEAYAWLQATPNAVFIDVRMEIEYLYVGRPHAVVHVPWYEYPDFVPDPARFAAQCLHAVEGDKARPVLLLCRSAKRTIPAGAALEAAGFTQVQHVLHGFEGDMNPQFHRSSVNGWRFDGLPWEQL